jgi:hypothetical protein
MELGDDLIIVAGRRNLWSKVSYIAMVAWCHKTPSSMADISSSVFMRSNIMPLWSLHSKAHFALTALLAWKNSNDDSALYENI